MSESKVVPDAWLVEAVRPYEKLVTKFAVTYEHQLPKTDGYRITPLYRAPSAPSADQEELVGRLIARADILSLTGASDVEKELRDAAAAIQSAEAGRKDAEPWHHLTQLPMRDGLFHVWHEAFPAEVAQAKFESGSWHYMDGEIWPKDDWPMYWREFPKLPNAAIDATIAGK